MENLRPVGALKIYAIVGEQSRINAVCRAGLVCRGRDSGLRKNRRSRRRGQPGNGLHDPSRWQHRVAGGRIVVPRCSGRADRTVHERMDEVPLALTGLSVFGPVLNAGPSDASSLPIRLGAL